MPCQPFPAWGWWVPHHPAYDDDGEHGGGSGGNDGGKDGGKDDQLQGQWERHNTTNNFCPNQGSSCSPGTSPTQVNTMQCKGCGCGEALKLQWGVGCKELNVPVLSYWISARMLDQMSDWIVGLNIRSYV